MSENNDNNPMMKASPSIGARLKQKRESKQFSVAEVAAQLRLTKEIIIYLETQQWEKLHGRTYARGYFSSYVRYLNLPYDEMLAVFDDEYLLIEVSPKLNYQSHSVDQKPFPWAMWILIVLAIIIIGIAFQQWQAGFPISDMANDLKESTSELLPSSLQTQSISDDPSSAQIPLDSYTDETNSGADS
ncbi:MAG TPA: hypothetical protein ENI26_05785 [Methylophaga aminisulfidivorans]|uniref:Uncharacterized protein n=2 Tax=root TaxID=1 RepID=A0A7C1ZVF3_9GAMM|nr:hypothetical protein [Methylophaga aminisulfidivorans]HEC73870.1 hypothetical protein [Methylophaga aminisulfidivorans]